MTDVRKPIDLSQFERAIAQIRVGFGETLDRHLADLTPLVTQVRQGEGRAQALCKAGEIAHKIRGVAKTLEYEELGRIAALTENATDEVRLTVPSAGQIEAIGQKLSELIDCILQIRGEAALS